MKQHKSLAGIILFLFLSSLAWTAVADQNGGTQTSPPPFRPFGLSGICADQQYLYVMANGKIMQFGLADMKLINKVDLPEPADTPADQPAANTNSQKPPPPPMDMPHGIWAAEGTLYVLAGHEIYLYIIPDLTLQATIELPKPELPKVSTASQ